MWSSTAFFVGFPFVAIVVNVPQRAQAVVEEKHMGRFPGYRRISHSHCFTNSIKR
jgi:hypothetical protein